MKKTAVLIPVYNEAQSLAAILTELTRIEEFDIVVIDDASTDTSLAVAREFDGLTVLPLRINLGAWGALQAGIRYAHKKGYEQVITMDGDGQHHVGEISTLIAANGKGVDVVIGACPERGSTLRRGAWSYFRKLTGVAVEDITSGFRLYNREAIRLLTKKKATLLDYQDVGVLLLFQDARLRVVETTVKMSARSSGISHIYYSWFAVAYYMLFTTVLSLAKGKPFQVKKK